MLYTFLFPINLKKLCKKVNNIKFKILEKTNRI